MKLKYILIAVTSVKQHLEKHTESNPSLNKALCSTRSILDEVLMKKLQMRFLYAAQPTLTKDL